MTATPSQDHELNNQSDEAATSLAASQTTPERIDPNIGQTIGSVYIETRLGAGAMASIYRARDRENDTPLAVKVLTNSADEVLQERFRAEARTVRQLDHPHIVKTVDSGQSAQGLTYISMELIEGEDLGSLLERRHQLSVLDASQILTPIADALSYAHSVGIIHRDVKPSNILLQQVPAGTEGSIQLQDMDYAVIPLLSDFGIARALDAPELTSEGRTIGTPAYMSPEQCAGNRQLDGRADIYSLGTVLYRALVGRPPFVGTTTQILHAHVYESLTIPDAIADTVPSAILTILQKSLQKDPNDRYSDPAEIAAELVLLLKRYPGTLPTSEANPANERQDTATMPSLPTATGSPREEQRVLVPGRHESRTTGERTPHPVVAAASHTATHTTSRTKVTPAIRTTRRTRSATWLAILLGLLLTGGSALLFFLFAASIGPRFSQLLPGPDVTTTSLPVVINGDSTPATPATIGATGTTAATSGSGNGPTVSAAGAITSSTGITDEIAIDNAISTTVMLTESGTFTEQRQAVQDLDDLNVAATWEDVKNFYENGDWSQTRWHLTNLLSIDRGIPELQITNQEPVIQAKLIREELLDQPDAGYWVRWADYLDAELIRTMLINSFVGLAMQSAVQAADNPPSDDNQQPTSVVESADETEEISIPVQYLTAAISLAEETGPLIRLRSATDRIAGNAPENQEFWRQDFAAAYLTYAESQVANGQSYCLASEILKTLNQYTPELTPQDQWNTYRQLCEGDSANATPTPVPAPAQFGGTIYYSTEAENQYRIYRVPLFGDRTYGESTIVLEHGAQPSLKGTQLAFYSWRNESQGLSGIDLSQPFAPDQRFARYTGGVEDARESPAQWNTITNQLVFSSKVAGDDKSRVYVVSANLGANNVTMDLGLGMDPIWFGDQILFSDTGVSGNTPGLWLMSATGENRTPLTSGNDRRPVWTAIGDEISIVFMRRFTDDDWHLFRYDFSTGKETLLTWGEAKNGLPAISPDGRTVLFATDRREDWELWTVSIDGGEAEFLMPLEGLLLQWLEHAILWVN